MGQEQCSKCGRKIVWAKMPSGKMNPFVKVTTYWIEGDQAVKVTSKKMNDSQLVIDDLYISHFVDCPKANEF